ncbi:MAG: amidohydrolase family protein [Phycisphaerales bacterium JB039]
MSPFVRAAVCSLILAAGAAAQDLTIAAPPQSGPIAIVGGMIHTGADGVIEGGYLLIEDGMITEIGEEAPDFGRGTRMIDAAGLHIYPGLIYPYSQLGNTEIGSLPDTQDSNETGDMTPEVRAAVSVNPDSTLIPVARTNGILIAGSFPTGGTIPGRASVLQLDGWTWEDMAVDDAAGLVISWPGGGGGRFRFFRGGGGGGGSSFERIEQIDEFFDTAEAYFAVRAEDATAPEDLRFEAMRDIMAGAQDQEPVFVMADDVEQIQQSVTWAIGRGLKPVIVGGQDAALVSSLLVEHDVPVIVQGTHGFPKRADSPYDDRYALPARLEAAGITWCLSGSDRGGNERNLPQEAGMAVAFGLDEDAAIRGMTINAARALGVADRLGTIEPGKDATIIITDGSPIQVRTTVQRAFIAGREIDLSNKQTALRDKYREKYRQLGIIEGASEGGR